MSYAEAAASSGPTGAKKIPAPKQVKQSSDPSGSVEVVDSEEFEHLKKEAKDVAKDVKADSDKKAKEIKKELEELEKEGKSLFHKAVAQLQQGAAQLSSYLSTKSSCAQTQASKALNRTSVELQNPVVVAQALVGITGIVTGYFAYLERKRINTDSKLVLGVHASVIAGLIFVDGLLFNKYYPKYDKKKNF